MPTNTDLVTDLPADFEVFGQAVDTSLADLKGGTSGQILAKNSNTDMDFVWITNDQGDITGITATSPLTGGGTSGAVTVGIQSATTSQSGAVQLTDSTSSTSTTTAATPNSVKSAYDPAFTNNFYAGKNKIINGNFGVNQRAFTSTTTTTTYTFDRWITSLSDGTVTYSSQAFTPGAAPVAGYEGTNFLRIVTSGQTLSSARSAIQQRIEDVRTLAGQTVTVSFWAKAASGTPFIASTFQQVFGSGGSTTVNVTGQKTAITTSWARYSFTFNVPSLSGLTIGTSSYLQLRLFTSGGSDEATQNASMGIQNGTIDIWGVQVEAGSTATPFQTATGTLQGELAACQRYYWKAGGNAVFQAFGNGLSNSTTSAQVVVTNPVSMRTTPSSHGISTLGLTDTSSTFAITNSVIAQAGINQNLFQMTSAGLTAFRGYILNANNSTSAYIEVSAEL